MTTVELKLTAVEKKYLRSLIYADIRRMTKENDHAKSHGDVAYHNPDLQVANYLVDQIDNGKDETAD